MKVKDKIKNFFYLEEEEEYVEEQAVRKEPIRQQAVPQQQARQQQVQPPIANRPAAVKKQSMKERQKQVDYPANVPNLVSITQKTSKLVLSEPRVYSEAQDIADNLKNKRAVVVNLQRIERDQGMRIIDFISGTIFALGGDIKKIGKDIFLCTPDNMEVDGNISEYLYDDQ